MLIFEIILHIFAITKLGLTLHQGFDYLTLVTESDSETIPCVSKNSNQWSVIGNNKIIIYKWYNITEAEVDPDLDSLDFIKNSKFELGNNFFSLIIKNDQVFIPDASLDLTGYYLCIIKYGPNKKHLKKLEIRHLITVTKVPQFNLVIKLPLIVMEKERNVKTIIIEQVEQILKCKQNKLKERLTFDLEKVNCEISKSNSFFCTIQLIIKYLFEVKKTCNKACAIDALNFDIKQDIYKITKLINLPNKIKTELSEISFDYFVECDLGYEINQHQCVPCNLGFYRNETFNKCQACPQNMYQSKFGQQNCDECPKNMYTLQDAQGSTSIKQCFHHGFLGTVMDESKKAYSNLFSFLNTNT